MDMLPKHMCHRCSYKLEEFHKFYIDCLKTDADLKSQLSWMRKEDFTEDLGVPMVHIENIRIKTEPPEYDIYDLDPISENVNYINSMSSVSYRVNNNSCTDEMHERLGYSNFDSCTRCKCDFDQNNSTDKLLSKEDCGRTKPVYLRENSSRNNCNISDINIPEDTKIQCEIPTEVQGNNNESESCADDRRSNSCTGMATSLKNAVVVNIDKKLRNISATYKLRPGRRSIDCDGNKNKIRIISTLKENKIIRNIKDQDVITNMKQEPPDHLERRILRPRKNIIDYMQTKRRSSKRERDTLSNSTNNEYYLKRHKIHEDTENTSSAQSRINESVMKKEKEDDYENCTTDMHINNRSLFPNKQNCIKNLMKSFDPTTNNVIVKLEQCVPDCVIIDDKKANNSFDIIEQRKSLPNVSKKKLKSEKIAIKRIAKNNKHFAPKHLRSQDAQLRSGKILNYESIPRSTKNSKRNIFNTTKNNAGIKKITVSTKSLTNIKYYCEKCNFKFANKELYKLHACYYD
ncbi:uncharacterized protein LOC107269447 isoform X2 [Cephus cinctus]|nr:uncharacterized protein LOC107269447 isoform X2 [Cephus cinctus]